VSSYVKAAEQVHVRSIYAIGSLYDGGRGVERDHKQAFFWYPGTPGVALPAAWLVSDGVVLRRTLRFNQAAEHGDPKAQFNIAVMHEDGEGAERDLALALKWYTKSAESGYKRPCYELGRIYENAECGVEKVRNLFVIARLFAVALLLEITHLVSLQQDMFKAFAYYLLAARKNESKAQFKVGVFYSKGYAVHQDYKKAMKW
jgi:TPR repeat protein